MQQDMVHSWPSIDPIVTDIDSGCFIKFFDFWITQGECTGGQAKAWIYPSCLLQPIMAKQIKQRPII